MKSQINCRIFFDFSMKIISFLFICLVFNCHTKLICRLTTPLPLSSAKIGKTDQCVNVLLHLQLSKSMCT